MPKEKVVEMRESASGRSMLSLYQACPRKWSWNYIKGFKPKNTAGHFTFGSAIHEAQEVFYKNNFNYQMMLARAEEFLLEHDPLLIPKALLALDVWYSKVGVHDMSNVEVLAVEEECFLTLPNGFKMTCRLDRLLRYKDTGEVFIDDTKTTGWSLEGTLRNYTYHDQPKLYFLAARETFPELMKDCRGWKTDGIYIKEKVSKGEKTGTYYTDAVRSETVTFRESDLEDVKNSYASYVDDMAFRLASVEEEKEPISVNFPKCGEHCLAYNKPCDYYSICHKVDSIDGVPANFKLDDWVAEGTVLNNFRTLNKG